MASSHLVPTTPHAWRDPARDTSERVEALLAQMTLAEKVAQLGSYWPQPHRTPDGGGVAPMEHAFPVGQRAPD